MATGAIQELRKGEKASSRDILLRSACELMIERNTVDISLSDIAKHSGINSAMVRYYFGTKQGMMIALVEDVLGPGLAGLKGLLEMDMGATQKLKLHVRAVIDTYFRYPFVNRLLHELLADPTAGEIVANIVCKPLAETQRQLLELGTLTGEFKPIDPMMFYFIVLGACDHIFFGQNIMRTAFNIEGGIDDAMRRLYSDTLIEMILIGILQKPHGEPATS